MLMFTVIGLGVSTALICIFECWPVELYWDIEGQLSGVGKCLAAANRQTFFEANGILKYVSIPLAAGMAGEETRADLATALFKTSASMSCRFR